MSKTFSIELSCPFCQSDFPATLYRTIWIEDSENRKLVFEDKINVVTCPNCGRESHVQSSLLATNVREHIAVWYEPYPDPQVEEDLRLYAKHMGADSFYATAPRIRDWAAFKEKIVELEQRTGMKPGAEFSPEMQQKLQSFIRHIAETQRQGASRPAAQPAQAVAPSWWRQRSKAFRVWCFVSVCWAVAMFLVVQLFDPFDYGYSMSDGEVMHMLTIMFGPPLLIGAGKRAWDRWVK